MPVDNLTAWEGNGQKVPQSLQDSPSLGATKILSGFAFFGKTSPACCPSIIERVRATVSESVKVKKLAGSFLINAAVLKKKEKSDDD